MDSTPRRPAHAHRPDAAAPSAPTRHVRPHAHLPAALPADQGAPRAEPRRRRVAARRGHPERKRARRRATARRRERCARPSPRWPPTTSWSAGRAKGRSSRRTRRRRSSHFRFLRIRRNDDVDEYPGEPTARRAPRQGVGGSGAPARPQAGRSRDPAAPGARVSRANRSCSTRSRCRGRCFKGLTKARVDAYQGSMYSFFETQFGVRMLKAQEKLRARSGRRRKRPASSACARAIRCLRSIASR